MNPQSAKAPDPLEGEILAKINTLSTMIMDNFPRSCLKYRKAKRANQLLGKTITTQHQAKDEALQGPHPSRNHTIEYFLNTDDRISKDIPSLFIDG